MDAVNAQDASGPKPIRRLEDSLVNKIAAGEVSDNVGTVSEKTLTLQADYPPSSISAEGAH